MCIFTNDPCIKEVFAVGGYSNGIAGHNGIKVCCNAVFCMSFTLDV
jgi:hypothetical protein